MTRFVLRFLEVWLILTTGKSLTETSKELWNDRSDSV